MLDLIRLVSDMNGLAGETWDKVVFSATGAFKFNEDSITEHNLYMLAQAHPDLLVRRMTNRTEGLNGADWEWWIGGRSLGWIGVRVQAKKLFPNGRYNEMPDASDHKPQYDRLVESCIEDTEANNITVWPLFCFYNGWQGPKGVEPEWPRVSAKPLRGLPAVPRKEISLRHYGCAFAPAVDVALISKSATNVEQAKGLGSYFGRSYAWSHLFDKQSGSPVTAVHGVAKKLDRWSGAVLRDGDHLRDVMNVSYSRFLEYWPKNPGALPEYAEALLNGDQPSTELTRFVAVLDLEEARSRARRDVAG